MGIDTSFNGRVTYLLLQETDRAVGICMSLPCKGRVGLGLHLRFLECKLLATVIPLRFQRILLLVQRLGRSCRPYGGGGLLPLQLKAVTCRCFSPLLSKRVCTAMVGHLSWCMGIGRAVVLT